MTTPLFTTRSICIPEPEIPILVDRLQTYLFPLLRGGVTQACETYRNDRGFGADNRSFGFTAWSYPAQQFRNAIEEKSIPFEFISAQGSILGLGRYRIYHHCVAKHAREDIRKSVPKQAKGLGHEWDHLQQLLFAHSIQPGESRPIVLAYAANPYDGLGWVYLTTVGSVRNKKVKSWDQVIPIWTPEMGDPATAPSLPELAPPEVSPVPTIRRRKKPRVEEG